MLQCFAEDALDRLLPILEDARELVIGDRALVARLEGEPAAPPRTEGEGFMAARPTWKGFLKISLVNIPVRVFPATDSAAKPRGRSSS